MKTKYEDYSREDLIRLLRQRERKPRFGLHWERDEIDHDRSINSDFVALDFDQALSCGNGPYRNLVIEGDNFDVLRYLRMTHAGRVKCIYIDPPYNTGNRDFIYNDHFVEKDDLYRPSKWLEYLYRRLDLARELLAEDGVLFVSINDDNRAKLELLLDQTFPGMRIGSMAWRTRDSTSVKDRNFSDVHEHILIYGGPTFSFRGSDKTQKKYKNPDNDPRGPWNVDPLTLAFDRVARKNLFYPIENPKTGNWYPCDADRVWAYASEKIVKDAQKLRTETMEEWIRQDKIVFPDPKTERVVVWKTKKELLAAIQKGDVPVTPKKKLPLLTMDTPDLDFWVGRKVGFGRPGFKKHWKDLRSHINPVSSWIARLNEDIDAEDAVTLRSRQAGEGTDALQAIFGKKVFDFPKPPSLIKALVGQATAEGDLVMDFFAGSGTTAQAVLELNAEDGLDRSFVLVSTTEASHEEPDANVCRDVCAERIRKLMSGYRGNAGLGGSFGYMRARRIPAEKVFTKIQHDQVWTALQLIHMGAVRSFDPKAPMQTVDNGREAVIYVATISEPLVREIKRMTKAFGHVTVYSWQPALLEHRISDPRVTFAPIPQYLVNRFGAGARK